jgi:hypothetical protein
MYAWQLAFPRTACGQALIGLSDGDLTELGLKMGQRSKLKKRVSELHGRPRSEKDHKTERHSQNDGQAMLPPVERIEQPAPGMGALKCTGHMARSTGGNGAKEQGKAEKGEEDKGDKVEADSFVMVSRYMRRTLSTVTVPETREPCRVVLQLAHLHRCEGITCSKQSSVRTRD